jgi:heme-degrading monooxygenase HmoA
VGAYAYIWEFRVRPESAVEFERAYGPDGDWVKLFCRAVGYESTMLLRDTVDGQRYLTIDRWRSEDDYREFHRRFAAEYGELDQRCAGLTVHERALGTFNG